MATLRASGILVSFCATLFAQQVAGPLSSTRDTEVSLPQPAPTGENGSWFVLPAAAGNVVMRAGSESKWVTVAN